MPVGWVDAHRRRRFKVVCLATIIASLSVAPTTAGGPIPDHEPPVVGTIVVSETSTGSPAETTALRVSWPAATDVGSGIARFEIAVGPAADRTTIAFAPGSAEGHEVALPGDAEPVLAVRALDRAGNTGEWAEVATGDPQLEQGEEGAVTVVIAGDIASCSSSGDTATARLVRDIPGIVMTAGDNVYPSGTLERYRECYGPSWGEFKDRTRPTLGNHDFGTVGAADYFRYFGWRAGPAGRGYYAFNAGTWRIYALNSQLCFLVQDRDESGCAQDSRQYRWLAEDLAERPHDCVMAVWHHPKYSSGPHGNAGKVFPLVALLYRSGAELVVNGHDHIYERFAPQRADGVRDDEHGIRQFIAGTGGGGLYAISDRPARNSVVRSNASYGVLRLRLSPTGYRWSFVRTDGRPGDRGQGDGHGVPD